MRKSTLVAALLLAALGGYVLWLERESPADPDSAPVFGVDKADVARIEIRRRGEAPVAMERTEESFRLVAPLEAHADATEVDLLLQNLATMAFERVVANASDVDLEEFGLADPGIEVRFALRGGSERSIAFGKDTPTTSNQYARRDGADEILVLRSHLSLNFEKSAWDLRDKSIFDAPASSEIVRVTVDRPSGRLEIARENGLFHVLTPRRSRADRYQVEALVSRFREAEMRDIASESGALEERFGLEAPTRRLRIRVDAEAAPMSLDVGAEAEFGFFARAPSRVPVFVLGSELVEELDRAAGEFESKKLFDFSAFEVTKFRIGERIVTEEEDIWRESGRERDRSAVEEFLYALNGASASEVLPGSGIDRPDFEISVWSKQPSVEESVRVVKVDGNSVHVHRAGDDVLLKLSGTDWSRIEELLALEPKTEGN